ncbi:MAG TPA: hypothetical protein VMJ34_03500 [Bryobacteraceae bacterium]|nr:hypothetical protein [Bryobacteraceae bacterium]
MRLVKIVLLGMAAVGLAAAQGHGLGEHGRGFGFAAIGPWGRTPVTGAPYSAVEVRSFSQTLAGGNQITRQEQTKVWRDSQGRVRTEMAGPDGRVLVTVFDPVAGNVVRLDQEKQTALVRTFKAPGAGAPSNPRVRHAMGQAPGAATEDLGPTTVNGRAATATKITRTVPAGSIGNQQPIVSTRTVWMSPELKVPLQIISEDPRWGTSTVTLQNIVQAEPDPVLFQIPSGYAVVNAPRGHGRGPGMSE